MNTGEEFLAVGSVGFDVNFFPGFQLGYVAASAIVQGGAHVAGRDGHRCRRERCLELGFARVTAQAGDLIWHRRDGPRVIRIQNDIVFFFRAAHYKNHHEKGKHDE